MRLSILLLCFFHGTCWTSEYYCAYQPKTLSVKEGDSVTIPCSYTYPKDLQEKSRIIVTWAESDGSDCSNIKKYITDQSGKITDAYKDRISTVNHPDNQTESLIIRGLKASYRVTFCCRATIQSGSREYTWYDRYGTSLTFDDGKFLSQVEELIAVPGEEMIIPCHYPLKTLEKDPQVTWYTGKSDLCPYNENAIYTWNPTRTDITFPYSLVNFPVDVSLRIHSVQRSEYSRFCCIVTTSNVKIQSRFGTELTITGSPSSSPLTVTQPYNITGHRGESVTLRCSYSSYMESDVLGVNIYWRVGNISGPYIYHPYKEMVHPSYRGRTEIKGAADLHIQGLQMSDDSMYYCFVMIRLCTGPDEYKKLIQYGEGTRLIVTDPLRDLVIYISISAAVLLVLLCLILIILKATGVICKKKSVSHEAQTPESPENEEFGEEERPYCEIVKNTEHDQEVESNEGAKKKMMESKIDEQEEENILYSELNKTKLQQRNPASDQMHREQTVYASVTHPDSKRKEEKEMCPEIDNIVMPPDYN